MPELAAKIYKLKDGKKHTKLGLQVFKNVRFVSFHFTKYRKPFYNQVKSSLNSHEL